MVHPISTSVLPQHLCSEKALGQVLLVLLISGLARLRVRVTSARTSCRPMLSRSLLSVTSIHSKENCRPNQQICTG